MPAEVPLYSCIREDQINKHEVDITELKTRVEFKHQRIDELKQSIDNLDKKLDRIDECLNQLRIQSERDDYDIDSRVTKLETTQNTIKWVVGIGLSVVGTAIGLLAFLLTYIH